jgi:hypothetical protein
MDDRIIVSENHLAGAIAGWLRHIPRTVWEQYIEHKILQHYKRSSLQVERLETQIARHVASEMARLDWQVTFPRPEPIGSPPPWSGRPAGSGGPGGGR